MENKAKIIFIACIAFFVLVLLVITYFIYFDNEEEESENNLNANGNISNMDRVLGNNNDNVIASKVNNINNSSSVERNRNRNKNRNERRDRNYQTDYSVSNEELNEFNESANLLDNVRDESYDSKVNQVFNISNNIFSYDDARAACRAHNAELATYDQVVDAYKSGADWCNYGWSENQMALYPTQKSSWDELQKDPKNANSCGEWGVNGGYFENPNTLFGANCYGRKPDPKDRERAKQMPVSKKERDAVQTVARFKEEIGDLTVSPFNKNLWSKR